MAFRVSEVSPVMRIYWPDYEQPNCAYHCEDNPSGYDPTESCSLIIFHPLPLLLRLTGEWRGTHHFSAQVEHELLVAR